MGDHLLPFDAGLLGKLNPEEIFVTSRASLQAARDFVSRQSTSFDPLLGNIIVKKRPTSLKKISDPTFGPLTAREVQSASYPKSVSWLSGDSPRTAFRSLPAISEEPPDRQTGSGAFPNPGRALTRANTIGVEYMIANTAALGSPTGLSRPGIVVWTRDFVTTLLSFSLVRRTTAGSESLRDVPPRYSESMIQENPGTKSNSIRRFFGSAPRLLDKLDPSSPTRGEPEVYLSEGLDPADGPSRPVLTPMALRRNVRRGLHSDEFQEDDDVDFLDSSFITRITLSDMEAVETFAAIMPKDGFQLPDTVITQAVTRIKSDQRENLNEFERDLYSLRDTILDRMQKQSPQHAELALHSLVKTAKERCAQAIAPGETDRVAKDLHNLFREEANHLYERAVAATGSALVRIKSRIQSDAEARLRSAQIKLSRAEQRADLCNTEAENAREIARQAQSLRAELKRLQQYQADLLPDDEAIRIAEEVELHNKALEREKKTLQRELKQVQQNVDELYRQLDTTSVERDSLTRQLKAARDKILSLTKAQADAERREVPADIRSQRREARLRDQQLRLKQMGAHLSESVGDACTVRVCEAGYIRSLWQSTEVTVNANPADPLPADMQDFGFVQSLEKFARGLSCRLADEDMAAIGLAQPGQSSEGAIYAGSLHEDAATFEENEDVPEEPAQERLNLGDQMSRASSWGTQSSEETAQIPASDSGSDRGPQSSEVPRSELEPSVNEDSQIKNQLEKVQVEKYRAALDTLDDHNTRLAAAVKAASTAGKQPIRSGSVAEIRNVAQAGRDALDLCDTVSNAIDDLRADRNPGSADHNDAALFPEAIDILTQRHIRSKDAFEALLKDMSDASLDSHEPYDENRGAGHATVSVSIDELRIQDEGLKHIPEGPDTEKNSAAERRPSVPNQVETHALKSPLSTYRSPMLWDLIFRKREHSPPDRLSQQRRSKTLGSDPVRRKRLPYPVRSSMGMQGIRTAQASPSHVPRPTSSSGTGRESGFYYIDFCTPLPPLEGEDEGDYNVPASWPRRPANTPTSARFGPNALNGARLMFSQGAVDQWRAKVDVLAKRLTRCREDNTRLQKELEVSNDVVDEFQSQATKADKRAAAVADREREREDRQKRIDDAVKLTGAADLPSLAQAYLELKAQKEKMTAQDAARHGAPQTDEVAGVSGEEGGATPEQESKSVPSGDASRDAGVAENGSGQSSERQTEPSEQPPAQANGGGQDGEPGGGAGTGSGGGSGGNRGGKDDDDNDSDDSDDDSDAVLQRHFLIEFVEALLALIGDVLAAWLHLLHFFFILLLRAVLWLPIMVLLGLQWLTQRLLMWPLPVWVHRALQWLGICRWGRLVPSVPRLRPALAARVVATLMVVAAIQTWVACRRERRLWLMANGGTRQYLVDMQTDPPLLWRLLGIDPNLMLTSTSANLADGVRWALARQWMFSDFGDWVKAVIWGATQALVFFFIWPLQMYVSVLLWVMEVVLSLE